MNTRALFLMLLASPCSLLGQATPTASLQPSSIGLNLPTLNGTFQYGLSASEVVQDGYTSNGVYAQTSLSGDVAYASKSAVHPFSMLYNGGTQFGPQSGYGTTYYQSLALSQAYLTRSWVFGLSDVVSYLPESPTVGLSGIPGTGDLGLNPIQNGLQPSQDIISIQNNRVSNVTSGSLERRLDAFTSLSGGASYGILHFFGNGGLDSSQISADVAVNRRLNGRSSASLSATYGTFNYGTLGNGASFVVKGLSTGYQRQISRSLTASASGGPEWISSSSVLSIPSRLTFTAGAGLGYTVRVYNASLSYNRSITGGAGAQPGGISDTISATLQRPFGTAWSASGNAGYAKTQGLTNGPTPANLSLLGLTSSGNYDSSYIGAQVSRRLSRSFSTYASYTLINQSYSQVGNAPIALNGLVQTFALGISYFPRSLHLGQL